MKKEYCDIFNLCFPQFAMSYDRFKSLMQTEKSVYFDHKEGDEIVAFAIVEDFAIRLLCVAPKWQSKGIGKELLLKAEEHLAKAGYEKAITGGVSSRMFIGAVSDTWGFFEKHGYKSVGGCDEMLLDLKADLDYSYVLHGSEIAEYGWYEGSIEEIQKAVDSVDYSWPKYFTDPKTIYVGRVNGEIASFCLVEKNSQNYLTDVHGKVGMPGCVGTVPKFRNKGIALEMIARATQYLKDEGMDVSFIYYTGVADWYAKLGYKTFLSEVFAEKLL